MGGGYPFPENSAKIIWFLNPSLTVVNVILNLIFLQDKDPWWCPRYPGSRPEWRWGHETAMCTAGLYPAVHLPALQLLSPITWPKDGESTFLHGPWQTTQMDLESSMYYPFICKPLPQHPWDPRPVCKLKFVRCVPVEKKQSAISVSL